MQYVLYILLDTGKGLILRFLRSEAMHILALGTYMSDYEMLKINFGKMLKWIYMWCDINWRILEEINNFNVASLLYLQYIIFL